jgi:hypothetical protein
MNRCRRKKLENSFFSSSLFSFLPFRLDINEEKKENPLTYPATTINKWRKKEEAKEKKSAKSFFAHSSHFSIAAKKKRKKSRLTIHAHIQAFSVVYYYSTK